MQVYPESRSPLTAISLCVCLVICAVKMEDSEIPQVRSGRRLAVLLVASILALLAAIEFVPLASPVRDKLHEYVPALGRLTSLLSGWTETSGKENGVFKVMIYEDEFEGRQNFGAIEFLTASGVLVEGRMTCKSKKQITPQQFVEGISGLDDAMAEAFITDAKSGCPSGYSCRANLQLSFFRGSEGAPVLKISGGGREFPRTVYLLKNLQTGEIGKYKANLEQQGNTHYSNSVVFAAPTSGSSLSKLLYRFKLKGDEKPVDITLDYSQASLSSFAEFCEQSAKPRDNGNSVDVRTMPALGTPPTPNERKIAINAAKKFDNVYDVTGVVGVRSEVETCYADLSRKRSEDHVMYCFMIDHLLDLRDRFVSEEFGIPQPLENNSSSVRDRLCDGLRGLGFKDSECAVRVSRWSEVVELIYDGK